MICLKLTKKEEQIDQNWLELTENKGKIDEHWLKMTKTTLNISPGRWGETTPKELLRWPSYSADLCRGILLYNLGAFCRGVSWRIFLGTFSHLKWAGFRRRRLANNVSHFLLKMKRKKTERKQGKTEENGKKSAATPFRRPLLRNPENEKKKSGGNICGQNRAAQKQKIFKKKSA